MGLTPTQRTIIAKAKASGGGALGVGLDDADCAYLVAMIANDLGILDDLGDLGASAASKLPAFFTEGSPTELQLADLDFLPAFERLVAHDPAAETYFACLAALHKYRLKYERILEHQPLPTMDQVGPRALLQYGSLPPPSLATFLFWRKWMFDIDNRAGQETGYLFEPIIAAAIGGAPLSAKRSPVRRVSDPTKGRQVDCVREVGSDHWAYEFKIRVTIAASGQGRWREELEFPADCEASGFRPVLIVLDPTPNPKLEELVATFVRHGGEAHLGDDAWAHLESAAGETMTQFLEKYVRRPIDSLLASAPTDVETLPDLHLSMSAETFTAVIENDRLVIPRAPDPRLAEDGDTDDQALEDEEASP